MVLKRLFCCLKTSMAVLACCYFSSGAVAAMTLDQMKSLKGAAQLEITVDRLFLNCSMPASILDHGSSHDAKQSLQRQGASMHLSAMDWDIVYGNVLHKPGITAGWVNRIKSDQRCTSGLSQLLFRARGDVGVLEVTKNKKGIGYTTAYHIPADAYKAHKVVGVEAVLARAIPVSQLRARYGEPDEDLRQAADKEKLRYWVVTLRNQRPELLYAVDFVIDKGACENVIISSTGVDFVQHKLDFLLRDWEKNYILD
jgi:hypothetical protein